MNELESLKSQLKEEIKRREQLSGIVKDWQQFGQQLSAILSGVTTDEWIESAKQLTQQLLSALAAIEKHNNAPPPDCPWGKIDVDLSLLRERDAQL